MMKNKRLLAVAGKWFLVLIVTILTFKFIMWNWWQFNQAAEMTRKIADMPGAVNLTIKVTTKDGSSTLFEKSFAGNRGNKTYIINQFHIGPYINGNLSTVELRVNGQILTPQSIERSRTFDKIVSAGYCFIFTTPACSVEEFLELTRTAQGTAVLKKGGQR